MIPPERGPRRRSTKKETTEAEGIIHREHPMRREKLSGTGRTHELFSKNPRGMIVDQLENNQLEYSEYVDNEDAPKITHSPIEREVEKALGKNTTWPYSLHANKDHASLNNTPPQFPEYPTKRNWGGLGQWLPWLTGIGIVVIVLATLLNFFSGATVTIVPKHDAIPMDQKFSALKNPGAGDLPYAIMKEAASSSLEVPATGEKTVTVKASGKIVVYNEQLSEQRLIKNTRFQTPTGKIYRINESITLPKGTMKGAGVTPGFFEVAVYADEAGPEYNSPPTDFTLPGLKNSSIYEKVYARGKEPLTGGAIGTIKTVSEQDLKQASENLRIQLETKLRSKARGSLAPFQIAYDQGIIVELEQPSLSKVPASSDNKAVVSEEGTIYVITFKRDDLVKSIVKALVPAYKGEQVEIKNIESFRFATGNVKGSDLLNAGKLDFTLKGTPELSWVINEETLKKALLGISKEHFNGILAEYPSIDRAEANIRPMWKNVFPEDPARISIVLSDKIAP